MKLYTVLSIAILFCAGCIMSVHGASLSGMKYTETTARVRNDHKEDEKQKQSSSSKLYVGACIGAAVVTLAAVGLYFYANSQYSQDFAGQLFKKVSGTKIYTKWAQKYTQKLNTIVDNAKASIEQKKAATDELAAVKKFLEAKFTGEDLITMLRDRAGISVNTLGFYQYASNPENLGVSVSELHSLLDAQRTQISINNTMDKVNIAFRTYVEPKGMISEQNIQVACKYTTNEIAMHQDKMAPEVLEAVKRLGTSSPNFLTLMANQGILQTHLTNELGKTEVFAEKIQNTLPLSSRYHTNALYGKDGSGIWRTGFIAKRLGNQSLARVKGAYRSGSQGLFSWLSGNGTDIPRSVNTTNTSSLEGNMSSASNVSLNQNTIDFNSSK